MERRDEIINEANRKLLEEKIEDEKKTITRWMKDGREAIERIDEHAAKIMALEKELAGLKG